MSGRSSHGSNGLVPLVIADPTHSYTKSRVSSQVRSIDILPTVAELLEVPLPRAIDGRSLVPLMRGEEKGDRIAFGGITKLTPPRFFIRNRGYKFIESSPREGEQELSPVPPRFQLYDLRRDPGELNNLAESEPKRVRRLHKKLVELIDDSQGNSANTTSVESATEAVDPELRERLRSLGYIE